MEGRRYRMSLSALLVLAPLCYAADASADSASAESASADDANRASASAQVKIECAQAYEHAQRARNDGELTVAREHAVTCAQDACPTVLSADCANWVEELEAAIPTHIFELTDAEGHAVANATVAVDGGQPAPVSGQPVPFDPGSHQALFRSAGGEEVAVSFQSTSGQQNVLVRGSLAPEAGAPVESGKPIPTASWVLGGIGVVGVGVFGALAISGSTRESTLKDECSSVPCNRERGDSVKALYLGADIALGVGLVSLGAGVAWWALTPSSKEQQVSVRFAGPRGSTGMSLRSTF